MDSGHILIVALGLFLALSGFNMAFRQTAVRRWLGRPAPPRTSGEDEDALAYALRISGMMIMAFGIVIGGMFTAFQMAS